jgi:RimJ/RimL family protein N-acetyltransferase
MAMSAASEVYVPEAPYSIGKLTIEDGLEIATWRSPGPWMVQDALTRPPRDEGYWAVRDARGSLIGFCCFGEAARVRGLDGSGKILDVALGLRPDLTGRGLSREFAQTVVTYARSIAEGRELRCVVADWNALGRNTAEAVGFTTVGVHRVTGGGSEASYFILSM